MPDENNNNTNSWFYLALFLIFMTLKLTNYIDWSWWWITSPLWLPASVLLLLAGICFLLHGILNTLRK